MAAARSEIYTRSLVGSVRMCIRDSNQSAFYSEKAESLRQGLNHWLRNKAPIEALWDFDQVAGDPQDSQKLYQLFDSGDGLHISSVGGNHLAAAVDFQQLATLLGID